MSAIAFDPAYFRKAFPAFGNDTCFSDEQLQMWFDIASAYISVQDNACFMLHGPQRVAALNLMTAHMGFLFNLAATGETPQILTSATIDKVSVTVEPPESNSQFQWWLNTSPYGQQLLALLMMVTAGGIYVGGLPERAAIRRVGGGFGGVPPFFRG